MNFEYDVNIKGILCDVILAFFLCQITGDDAKRHQVIGSMPASGRANFKYCFKRDFKFNHLNDTPGHYKNFLSPTVLF